MGQGTVTCDGRCWWERTHLLVVRQLPLTNASGIAVAVTHGATVTFGSAWEG